MLHLLGIVVCVAVLVLFVGFLGSFASDFLDYAIESLGEGVDEIKKDIAPFVEFFKKDE